MSRVGSLPCEASGQETSFIHANSPHHHTLLHSTQFQCIVSQHYIALPIIEKYECTQNSEMHIVYWTMHSSYTVKHLQKACCSRILDNVHWWTILGTFWGGTSQWCPLQLSHAFWASRGWPATADSLVIIGTFSPEMLKQIYDWLVTRELVKSGKVHIVKTFTCKICRKMLQSGEECGFHMQICDGSCQVEYERRVGVTDCNKHLHPLPPTHHKQVKPHPPTHPP